MEGGRGNPSALFSVPVTKSPPDCPAEPSFGVVLTWLYERGNFTPELFSSAVADVMANGDEKQNRFDATIDKLRARYSRSVVYFGGVHDVRETASMRISFTHIPEERVEG